MNYIANLLKPRDDHPKSSQKCLNGSLLHLNYIANLLKPRDDHPKSSQNVFGKLQISKSGIKFGFTAQQNGSYQFSLNLYCCFERTDALIKYGDDLIFFQVNS